MGKNKSTPDEYIKYTPQPKDMVLDDSELTPYPSDDTPAGYGRWDTFTGTITLTSKNTPEQQKLIDEINAQYEASQVDPASPGYSPNTVDWGSVDEAESRINYRMCIEIARIRRALGYELFENEDALLKRAENEGIETGFSVARRIAQELYPEVNYCTEYEDAYVFSDKNDLSFGGKSPVVILKKNGMVINMTEYIDSPHGEYVDEFGLAE